MQLGPLFVMVSKGFAVPGGVGGRAQPHAPWATQSLQVESLVCCPMAARDVSCSLRLPRLSLLVPCLYYPAFLLVAEHAVIALCWGCLLSFSYRPIWPCLLLPLKQKQISAAKAELFCLRCGLPEDPTRSSRSSYAEQRQFLWVRGCGKAVRPPETPV